MAINKKFIHFKRKSTFQRELEAGNILNTSIVFIADAKLIYLNGSYFSENTLFNLSDLLSTVSGDLTDTDTSNEAIVKLYKYLKEVDSNTDSLIKILMLEVSTLEETLTNRIDSTDLLVATELSNINQRLNTSENEITRLSESFKETDSITKILVEEVPSIELTLTNRIDNTDLLVATELGNINLKLDSIGNLVNITYSELKSLRDSSKLTPGRWYRITDFVTTVANYEEARSAGHPFDIIMMASDKDTLQEECHAIQHEGDEYFANCNLAAWKIWYCLDNDTTKYTWADTVNGKGVIYHMIDEWQNDCPYDFKNIMFNRTVTAGDLNIDGAYYTFSWVNEAKEVEDASIVGQTLTNDEGFVYGVHDNLISASDAYSLGISNNTMAFALNGNVFVSEYSYDVGLFYGIYGNHFAINCLNNTFVNTCNSNSFGNDCCDNTFESDCNNNSFGNYCNRNTFRRNCFYNTFGNSCKDNSFEYDCYANTFGNDCNNNTFKYDCFSNTFGNICEGNSFGYSCRYNSFGNTCIGNTYGNYFQYNAIGNDIEYIEIPTENIYHTHILNGTKGTSSTSKLTIEPTPNANYPLYVAKTSSGLIKVWNPADLNVIAE